MLDSSFVEKGKFDGDTFNGLASTRCSELGYWNYFAPIFDYTNIRAYADSIQRYVDEGLLRFPTELYYPVRLKPRGVNNLNTLREQGVDHIELRMFDLNPLMPGGIDERDLTFAQLFLMWLASTPREGLSTKAQVQAVQNFKNAAHYDLKTVKIVPPDGEVTSVANAALKVLNRMAEFYEGSGSAAVLHHGATQCEILEAVYSGLHMALSGAGSGGNAESRLSALESVYLKNRLTDEIREDILIAHIRKASVGDLSYKNSHPFARRDDSGRLWTLAHNGTIFESSVLEPYTQLQSGSTDSEQILYYLVDRINAGGNPGALSAEERFSIVEDVIRTITPKNMVNLLIFDGELLYTHANRKDSLHLSRREECIVISSKPLSQTGWEPVPLNTLMAFRRGELVYTGQNHGNEYEKVEESEIPRPTHEAGGNGNGKKRKPVSSFYVPLF